MKYVVELKDNGGKLTYTRSMPYFVNMLTPEYVKSYREFDLEDKDGVLLKRLQYDLKYRIKNAEIIKIFVHVNNLKYDDVRLFSFHDVYDFNIINTKEIYIPEPKYIYINYDFVSGKELSYTNGLEATDTFETNCLNFFNFEKLLEFNDIIVRKQNGEYISLIELINDKDYNYCNESIYTNHDVEKMLIANSFNWQTKE